MHSLTRVLLQARLLQQLHNAQANEELLLSELAAVRQQLQQVQLDLKQAQEGAQAAADAAAQQHQQALERLRQDLAAAGDTQVTGRCSAGEVTT
jgi:hypothetical protein